MRTTGRAVLVTGALLCAALVAVWQLAPTVRSSAGLLLAPGSDPAQVLVALVVLLCAAVLGGWWLWLLASVLSTAIDAHRDGARLPGWLVAPRLLRLALGLAVSTTVGSMTLTAPGSVAAPVQQHERPGPAPILPDALAGLRLPDRLVGGAPPRHRVRPARVGAHSARVRSGDSLWSIAARLLRRPTAARVAQAWPRLYAANRTVIGPDPDLIRPGTRLVVPVALERHDRNDRGGPR